MCIKSAVRNAVGSSANLNNAVSEQWLREFARMLYAARFSEEDLDEAVHEYIGGPRASSINNQGLESQLEALLEALSIPHADIAQGRRTLHETVLKAAARAGLDEDAMSAIRRFGLSA